MSGFKALNIESDDESDIEIDDTKEIQIEEALKLYQNALKYHAEGPASFARAAEAYRELFASDIFTYPESQAELRRLELYGPEPENDDVWDNDLGTAVATVAVNAEGGPSTLPQILHLSHKNYAQFKLEVLQQEIALSEASLGEEILREASTALEHFVAALDKDDTDLDLWRRTASVGSILDSKRVARYCLEAVLDGDDEAISSVMSLPGLEEGFAGEQLRKLITKLEDRLSLLQSPLSTKKRRQLSKLLKQRLDPYADIETQQAHLGPGPIPEHQPQRIVLAAPATWAELGDVLLRQTLADLQGAGPAIPGLAVSFDLRTLQTQQHMAFQAPVTAIPEEQFHTPPEQAAVLPNRIDEQFPGLDNGLPTAQPNVPAADDTMQPFLQPEMEPTEVEADVDIAEPQTMTLPSRKRSTTDAGLNDAEEGRTKSKRIRARESVAEPPDAMDANVRWEFEQQLKEFEAADEWMFDTVGGLFERVHFENLAGAKNVRKTVGHVVSQAPAVQSPAHSLDTAARDFLAFFSEYNDSMAHLLLAGTDSLDLGQGAQGSAYAIASGTSGRNSSAQDVKPLMDPQAGLTPLLESLNERWSHVRDATYTWLMHLLAPARRGTQADLGNGASFYTGQKWSETLKTIVVRVLVNLDDYIYERLSEQISIWDQRQLGRDAHTESNSERELMCFEIAESTQAIFELHLDIYCLIKQPNSGVDEQTITTQGERLDRWADIARDAISLHSSVGGLPSLKDVLNLRFLWATTFHVSVSDEIAQDHVVECMQELRSILKAVSEPVIELQNNAVMPELSVAALDREISRLTTRDFFLKVTDQDQKDPVAVIENLEPLLRSLEDATACTSGASGPSELTADLDHQAQTGKSPPELVGFLQNSNITVRLLLWQRLREAYEAIGYKPMVVSCYFSSIAMALVELKNPKFLSMPQPDRQITLLKTMRLVQDMVAHVLVLIQSSGEALDCMDDEHIRSTTAALGDILHLVQSFNVFEDYLRVGQRQAPIHENGLQVPSFGSIAAGLHDLQLHVWILLYFLLGEAMAQNKDAFKTPVEDKFDFIKTVHRNLGIRGICGGSNRAFVKLLKDELFQMTHVDGYEVELAQVLYDMYGLKCFLNPAYECIEHKCTHDAFLDRNVATQSIDLLLAQASRVNIKDLPKHPLKDTIDKVHGAVVKKKPSDAILRNREVCRAYLKSAINPMNLYKCLSGEGNQLTATPVPREDAVLASKGWYFLMGHIALSKFRSQKRTVPTPTEDVEIAIAFFMQDLEYSMDNWETWYRLAQAYDTKLEESVVWSSEKLNNSMTEVSQLQRAAIHSYTMATALALRSADFQFETSAKMADLYSDFAMRIYSSSRPPFSMLPFSLEDAERFFSAPSLFKGKPFREMRVFTAWKFARVLFQRAIAGKSQQWTLHYMLGKCLWKMHAATDEVRRKDARPSARQVLEAFTRVLELLPGKRDSRDSKREPLLEPHYKLVSIVHKLCFVQKTIRLEEALEALTATPFARTATFPDDYDVWVPHILTVLKNLRAADKSNWHHRMVARAAQLVYEEVGRNVDTGDTTRDALGAKHELTQQMFTKTMVLQVWRPEGERAGRHFIYTSAYTRFFVRILEQLKDRASLESLARRVRKRPNEFFQHSAIWHEICAAYLRLLREYGGLAEGLETSTFSSIAHEEFLVRKEPLEKWMIDQPAGTSPTLDVLREVLELKKINASCMKPAPLDDLIGDAYASLFITIGKQLFEEERLAKQQEEAARPPPPAPSPQRNPMMSLNHLMNLDGANETPVTLPSLTPAPPKELAVSSEQAAVPRRKTGVGRREIRTCAEACAQKQSASNALSSAGGRDVRPSDVRVQVLIESNRRPSLTGDASVATSAPGSVHDSADDESELSELEEVEDDNEEEIVKEEDAEKRLLFPGLAAKRETPERADDESKNSENAEVEQAEEHETTQASTTEPATIGAVDRESAE